MWLLPWCPPRSERLFLLWCLTPSADRGEVTLAAQDGLNRTGLPDREDNDRHTVLPGKREGRRIHDFQVAVERFLVVKMVVALGGRIALGIRGIDAVDIGRLENCVATHLGSAQDCCRVGGKIRVTGAAGEDDDAIVLKMTQR